MVATFSINFSALRGLSFPCLQIHQRQIHHKVRWQDIGHSFQTAVTENCNRPCQSQIWLSIAFYSSDFFLYLGGEKKKKIWAFIHKQY